MHKEHTLTYITPMASGIAKGRNTNTRKLNVLRNKKL